MVPEFSIGRNILLGWEGGLAKRGHLSSEERRTVATALAKVGASFDPDTKTSSLSVPHLRLAQIARALVHPGEIMILDEPTAVLSEPDAELLIERVMQFRSEGKAVLYVTHRLSEVIRMADRITVLRDGKRVGLFLRGEVSRQDIVQLMTKDVAASGHDAERDLRRSPIVLPAVSTGEFRSVTFVRKKIYASEPNCLIGADRWYRRRSRLRSWPFFARGCRRRCSHRRRDHSRRAPTAARIGATCSAGGNIAGTGRSSRSSDRYLAVGARQSLSRQSRSSSGPSVWAATAARRARNGSVLYRSSQRSASLCRHANRCAKRRQSAKDRDRPRTRGRRQRAFDRGTNSRRRRRTRKPKFIRCSGRSPSKETASSSSRHPSSRSSSAWPTIST